ncbi:hypothetical protein FIBSPDRAFT_925110 [Athelia psychrophila]|uniref:Uncharacterized protein n=1 Tax=Athelia psychrophila TaxID=1759441 RepID=A0A166VE54_9AGAM|nr:hypothetical protein FIBSPDRAFT_925110 [Fibularhizoctonia sp. CBS 109695]
MLALHVGDSRNGMALRIEPKDDNAASYRVSALPVRRQLTGNEQTEFTGFGFRLKSEGFCVGDGSRFFAEPSMKPFQAEHQEENQAMAGKFETHRGIAQVNITNHEPGPQRSNFCSRKLLPTSFQSIMIFAEAVVRGDQSEQTCLRHA